jgi:iron complex outermembrane receptor protein
MRTKFMALLLGSVSAIGFSNLANAQTAAPQAVETVVVTGSRLVSGLEMPTPVTVVSAQDLQILKPTNMLDAINTLPVFSGSRTQSSTGTPTGGTGGGSAASNQLNLRAMGSLRTLVLFDGQRVVPTSLTNVVDADIIPQMLIERVDVVTGGASAVYGSDAVIGVVNFIPDKNFNGVKMQLQGGESGYGDARNWKMGIAGGMPILGGRGHIEGSIETYSNSGVPSRFSRPWYSIPGVTGTGTAANPLRLMTNVRSNQNTFGGLITSGIFANQQFATNGVLTPFVRGTATGTPTSEIGGDGSYNDSSLAASLRWTQFYGRADFDLSENTRAHIQASYKNMLNKQRVTNFANNNLTLSSSNAFLPATYRTQLLAANQTTFRMSELVNKVKPWQADVYSNQTIFNAGLDGKVRGYSWKLDLNYGQSLLTDFLRDDQNNQNLAAALDAVVNPANGQIVCNVTLTNPGVHPGCVPINLFGPTAASPEALGYVYRSLRWDGKTKMYDANFSISGEPFSTWAGPVGVALSAEWRRTQFSSTTDDPSTALANCTGIRFNCTSGTTLLWQNAFSPRSVVGISVAEAAVETEVPLLKDIPLVQSLSLNAAARFMSYNTSGDYTAWKIGAVWQVNDELRFRATASRDIRAPTINDLFGPATIVPLTNLDLLTGLTPTVPQSRSGNPLLKPEIGRTDTAGVVYQPDWLPGASFSADVFDIEVTKAIVEIRGVGTSAQQACYASGGSSSFCQLQTRPLGFTNTSPANVVTAWGQKNVNVASLRTYGADFEANYVGEIFNHRFALQNYVTWQPHLLNITPGLPNQELAGVAVGANPNLPTPSLRFTLTQSFNVTEEFRIDLTERGRDGLEINGDTGLIAACCRLPAVVYFDLNLSYTLSDLGLGGYALDQSEIFFHTSNMFDQNPPIGPDIGFDDAIGRTHVLGLRVRF